MALEFQTDFKIGQTAATNTGQRVERVTLQLSSSGDIILVNKKEKLIEQLLRAIVNDNTLQQLNINSTTVTTRYVKSLVTLILRNFRTSQILETRKTDPDLLGYAIYRYNAGQNSNSFAKISPNSIQYKYVDNSVQNGITYTYAVTKIKANSVESAVMEKIEVTPTQFTNNQEPVIGTYIIGIPGNKSVTFYVDYNRLFSKQELLESIEDITVTQDPAEPRRWIVNVLVKSLDDNKVSISTSRFSITGK
jgi:hypothetical protein